MSPLDPQAPPAQPTAAEKTLLIKKLFTEICSAAKAKNFAQAEQLREKLIETDPMALSEIIKSSEILEEAMSANIDRDHLAIWSKLYDGLTDEERNCLFYSMKKYIVPPKKMLLERGAKNTRLFLIDKGQVTIFFPKDGQNKVLAQLGRGEVLGEYTFSTISLCSASAMTHSEVQLMCLESSVAEGWEEKHPGLYEKLINFCLKNGRVDEILRNKKLEKRNNKREPAQGKVIATLMTKEGQKSDQVFHGNLSDISIAGVCFTIRCSKKATARTLLARFLLLSCSIDQKNGPLNFLTYGKVVRVSYHLYDDYSVHVHFNKLLSEDIYIQFAANLQ